MNNIKSKLDEAYFFFTILKEKIESFNPTSVFYLSAFLSAAQSLIYLMDTQTSSQNKRTYDNWKENHIFLTSPLYEKFKNARGAVIHQHIPNTNRYSIKADFGPGGLIMGSGETIVEMKPFGNLREDVLVESEGVAIRRAIQKRDLLIEFMSKDHGSLKITEFSSFTEDAEEYLGELKKFFYEWESKFGTSNHSG